ncbi:CRISPR-associated helicase, Cas3 family [Pseudomonas delhiensis]|uniref:CRISPR-associated helicase, Cas3 family n=1 Tax=Pseudomonas delhiensis TaxID=366289 RepID=A0A239HZ70_9PSED|nr:CRISPR-associated helicase/endonuclease Cas3 [Pseudomonas delhiensis]SDI43396.1 CRISPR-associated helicase, Cas3 family [Pseudomonas delhiensis]SNS86003.1 CRISPR-associated helicase, Cas3 family [Pseudomonas delhiensis]
MGEGRLSFSGLSAAGRAVWAKSGDEGGHGLLAHLLDVAAVAETLLEIEPASTRRWASRALGVDEAEVGRWVAAIAGLHDFGKAIPGFQAKWPDGMAADQAHGLAFPASACNQGRHDLATASLLGRALLGVVAIEAGWLRDAVQAVSAHHGYHFLPDETNQGRPLAEPATWPAVRDEILRGYWQVLAPNGAPALDELSLPAVNWLAGLTSAADWIASNPEWFVPDQRGFDDLADYFRNACRLARLAFSQIGWRPYRPLLAGPADTDAVLARIVGRPGLSARPLQRVGDQLLQGVRGPALVVVEAPMGEGKTEFAFLAHLRLQAANGHRGLYVALPTQATGNALFDRALTFLEQFTTGPLDVQLVHGGAGMNEQVRHLRGIDHSSAESLSASAWFSQRKRPLLSAYGVGTIDQALFAALNVKHHFVRLWGLANRVVVLDEVHAYDTYTSGLIAALLRWLKALGCSVVLMSATLPLGRRAELLRAWGVSPDQVPELDYPRLLVADEGGIQGEHFGARPQSSIRLAGLDESLDTLADTAVELLAGGGCGALIVNTVERAQKLYIGLRQRLGDEVPLLLFHARFPADERAEREREVLAAFGTQGDRPRRALLVATQVAEQSLDIDFDFMLSDLAPVDLLLQRAGRLHRHDRERPAKHVQACLWVAGLRNGELPELENTAWRHVYDAYILLRTWALLRDGESLSLPADIDRLVQAVYGDDPLPDGLEEKARALIEIESYGEYLARVQKERRESFNIAIDPAEEPRSAYNGKPRGSEEGEGVGLENRTRLGPESITLIPVEEVEGGWCVRPGEPSFDPARPLDDAQARRLYERQLKVSRRALVAHFKRIDLPAAFEHPLLRNCYPLPLRQGQYPGEGLSLRLDSVLGLVYGPVDGANEGMA